MALLVMPRPSNPADLAFRPKRREGPQDRGPSGLSPLELESAAKPLQVLERHPVEDREIPGTDAKFDARFTAWLRENAAWVPLRVMLDRRPRNWSRPASGVRSRRSGRHSRPMEDAELANPGRAAAKPVLALVDVGQGPGTEVNPAYYPTGERHGARVLLQRLAPFYKAPYGLRPGLLALIFSLGVDRFGVDEDGVGVRQGSKLLYRVGIAGFARASPWRSFGFYLRSRSPAGPR